MNKNSGFAKGTLVHTDKGFVPIEQINVVDMVLSKPEDNPNGELSCQPITKTHHFENKLLYMFHVVEQFSDNTDSKIS